MVSRRHFIRTIGLSSVALTLGSFVSASGQQAIQVLTSNMLSDGELMSWISIDTSGKVTMRAHRSEMGQGTFQAIPQMIAEELEVDFNNVVIEFAAANPKKFGPQPNEGSFSVRGWYKQLLLVGASAREMLIEVAAQRFAALPSECYAANGHVIHRPSNKNFNYGELVEAASKLQPPKNVILKSRSDYKFIGKPIQRKDIPLKTNGAAIFGLDKKLPGMLYAVVERSPRFAGKVKMIDDIATKAVPGVKHVFTVQRAVFENLFEGVAVVADSLWAAMQGRKVLKVEWDDSGFEHFNTEKIYAQMHQDIATLDALPRPTTKFDVAFPTAAKKMEATYETPYQSHSCMEPLNCIANVQANSIEIWGPVQEANWIQNDLSTRMGIPIENITVNMTFLGGGLGRKAFPDYPHEAALISKHIHAPVQVMWTREDDMTAGPFRPGAVYSCKGGIDGYGKILAFKSILGAQAIWSNPTSATPSDNTFHGVMDGFAKPLLDSIPNYSFGYAPTKIPIPVMWWRSVYASTSSFAHECFIDELAHLADKDPLQFRRSHLSNNRYHALIDKMASSSGWYGRKKKRGYGVAVSESFGSICGHVVIVSGNKKKKIVIDKVIAVMDCGWYVNPDTIRAQLEGSVVMALGAALTHGVHFDGGRAVEQNFNQYPMPRIADTPTIETHIMENDEEAGGVGEPGLPSLAPALCNAIFNLTGKRIRKLPFNLAEV